MAEIKLNKRYKYTGDIVKALLNRLQWTLEDVTEFMNSIEDADVVEVVRCKDCDYMTYFKGRVMCSRYAKKINDETWYGLVATDNEHYCSYGERRDT